MSDQLSDLLNELLYSRSAEGAAFRERCIRNLEAGLLARQYETPEERETVLAEFYALATRLRELDAPLFNLCDKTSGEAARLRGRRSS